ncbi:MAG: flagellar hook-basal body complex protein FliE [Gammaproteobacteria bacterium]|nr:flagellar hook-basal body complex protein FliE [Gammaproteobacteria bacterium]
MNNTITPDALLAQMRAMMEKAQGTPAAQSGQSVTQNGFTDVLKQAVSAVNDQQQQADKLATAFQQGDPNVQMSQVMLSMQKASVSFQAMVEVRNKLVSAYQEIMNMQV